MNVHSPLQSDPLSAQSHERRPIMRAHCGALCDSWYAAAESHELKRGKPYSVTILGEKIVLWRDKEGRAAATLDRCLHRNALLSEGVIIDGCLACPYHGWMYDSAGQCVEVPSLGPEKKPSSSLKLESFPLIERYGLIWLWMGYGEPTGEPFEMPHYGEAQWDHYYMKTHFDNEVTHLVENFMDVPHTVFVHSGWFRSPARKRVECTVERSASHVCVTYHDDGDQIGDDHGFTSRLFNPKRLPLTHTDQFFLPNTTRVDYIWGEEERAFVITSTCTPINERETQVYTLISYKLINGSKLNPLRWFANRFLPWYTRRVIEQDVDIMKVQRAALNHHGETRFNETEADLPHLHIEALRQWAEDGGGEPLEHVTERIEMWI